MHTGYREKVKFKSNGHIVSQAFRISLIHRPELIFFAALFWELDVVTKAPMLTLLLFKDCFDCSNWYKRAVKRKLAVKSPSRKCPSAKELQSYNSFSQRRQQFYYSLKCSAMAFRRVWKSHLRSRSGEWAAWPWAHCGLSLSISTTLSLNNSQTSSLPLEANGFLWRRNQHRNTSANNLSL